MVLVQSDASSVCVCVCVLGGGGVVGREGGSCRGTQARGWQIFQSRCVVDLF